MPKATLPYKFEPGMAVKSDCGTAGIVVQGEDRHGALIIYTPSRDYARWLARFTEPDWDHPGTWSLLLRQYRDRSGHARAVIVWSEAVGEWVVDPDPYALGNDAVGSGKTEGAAIRDAFTRPAAADYACDGLTIDPVKLADRLSRIEATLARLSARVSVLDDGAGAS